MVPSHAQEQQPLAGEVQELAEEEEAQAEPPVAVMVAAAGSFREQIHEIVQARSQPRSSVFLGVCSTAAAATVQKRGPPPQDEHHRLTPDSPEHLKLVCGVRAHGVAPPPFDNGITHCCRPS